MYAAAHPPNGTWGWGDAPRAPNGMASGSEEKEEERDVRSAENTSLFSSFQHVAVGLAFAKGRPFRQPPRPTLTCSPSEWRVTLLALALGHFLRSAFLEVRFLLSSAPDDAPPSPPMVAPGGAEAPRAKTGLGGPSGGPGRPPAAHQPGPWARRCRRPRARASTPTGPPRSCWPRPSSPAAAWRARRPQEPDPEGPDLLMFYEPLELFAETPYLGVEGLPPLRLQPHVRPPASAFLMFRKLQQWEA
ncbi:unnamed protein product [Natator depressus]